MVSTLKPHLNFRKIRQKSTIPKELPISPKSKNTWNRLSNPERLSKIFKISDRSDFNNIVLDVLEMQSESFHDGRLTIQYPKIKMEIWTHDIMSITEADLEWAEKVDQIIDGYKK